ncbi:PilW family protein [Neobacillus sp. Marseille-QA0830]
MLKKNMGFTLVELLASLALLSIITLSASSFYFFSQKQSNEQSTDTQNQSNARLAMDILTKEIRSADSIAVSNTSNQLTIANSTGTDIYKFENNSLKKNSEPLITDLQNCSFSPYPNSTSIDYVDITVTSASLPATNLTTTIYLRK